MRDRKKTMWDFFKCQRCGKCCSSIGLPYDPYNLHETAKFLKLSTSEFVEKYYGKINNRVIEFYDEPNNRRTPCPFLEYKDNIAVCAIYNVRPGGCKSYPIDTDFGDQGIGCEAYNKAKKDFRIYQNKLYGD